MNAWDKVRAFYARRLLPKMDEIEASYEKLRALGLKDEDIVKLSPKEICKLCKLPQNEH